MRVLNYNTSNGPVKLFCNVTTIAENIHNESIIAYIDHDCDDQNAIISWLRGERDCITDSDLRKLKEIQFKADKTEWRCLNDGLKNVLINLSQRLPEVASKIGCILSEKTETGLTIIEKGERRFYDEVSSFGIIQEKEIEQLQKELYDVWVDEMIRSGWTKGEFINIEAKIHPDISEWEELNNEVKNEFNWLAHNIGQILSKVDIELKRLTPTKKENTSITIHTAYQ